MGLDIPLFEDMSPDPIGLGVIGLGGISIDPYYSNQGDLTDLNYSTSSSDLAGVQGIEYLTDEQILDFLDIDKNELENKVSSTDPTVKNEATRLAARYPGVYTIGQVCCIYEYLRYGNETRNKWAYVNDPISLEYVRPPNETLSLNANRSGVGDCDDFAILMSALIESIGGRTRIVFAYNESVGHAYSEVYLGRLGESNQNVEKVILWPMLKYSSKIYCHLNNETNEVWLNLDWWDDDHGVAHPGGPFIPQTNHTVVYKNKSPQKSDISPQKPEELTWGDIITSPAWEDQTRDLNEIMLMYNLLAYLSRENSPLNLIGTLLGNNNESLSAGDITVDPNWFNLIGGL